MVKFHIKFQKVVTMTSSEEEEVMTSLEVEEVESALAVVEDIIKKELEVKERKYPPLIQAIQEGEEHFTLILKSADKHDLEATDDEGNTAVMWAVKKNKPNYLKMLMNKQASPDTGNNEDIFPLHKAVDTGNEQLVEILCQCGADVNVVDGTGQTAVHGVVYYGSIPMLMTLLKYHANVNIADHRGKTALFLAVWKNHTDMVRLLLENNAKVDTTTEVNFNQNTNSEFEKVTPAMYAAATGYIRGLELLINFGADPHFRENDHKRSALFYAALFNHKACVDVILRESDLEKTLIEACNKGHIDYIKLLVEFNPDLEATDECGETALVKTIKHHDTDLLDILIEAGAQVDPNLPNEDSKSPLMSAACHGKGEHMKILLDKGASVNRINKKKYTALWFAADNKNLKCLTMLLKAGAPPNVASSKGTPLMAAISSGSLDCFKVLLEHGSETNYRNDEGECAVTLAATRYLDDYMKLLIDHNTNLHVEDSNGWSPLMLATAHKRRNVLKILIDNGASVNHADATGMTALHLAADNGSLLCLRMLLEAGAPPNVASSKGTPLMAAISSDFDCFKVLLEHGSETNYRNDKGECAVTLAATRYLDDYMKLLIDHNTDLHVEDSNGWSPVMLATSKKRRGVLKILIDNGASVNHADATGMTALHLAAQKDLITCLELLLSHNADMNTIMRKSRRSMSWTPLACAIKRRSKRGVLALLKHGALALIPDSAGLRTTMTRSFTPQVVRALHAAGADPDLLPDLVYRGDDSVKQLPQWRIRRQQPNHPTDLHDHEHDKTLFNICRLNIREHLLQVQPVNLFTAIPLLPLPNLIKSSLLFDVDLGQI